jgi:hypothetical protein
MKEKQRERSRLGDRTNGDLEGGQQGPLNFGEREPFKE